MSMPKYNKPEECEMGENLGADIALLGCRLMKCGAVRKEKDKIKEYVAQLVTAHLKNQKHSILSTLKSEVEGLLISEEELPEEYRMKGFLEEHQKTAVKSSNIAIKKVINLIDKHQN